GQLREARRDVVRASTLCEAAGDELGLADAHAVLAHLSIYAGDVATAERVTPTASRTTTHAGVGGFLGAGEVTQAWVESALGNHDPAIRSIAATREKMQRYGIG